MRIAVFVLGSFCASVFAASPAEKPVYDRHPGAVFGIGGLPGAESIVYVIDRSAKMGKLGEFLKAEIARGILKLKSTQKFNVVWFGDGEPILLAPEPVPATEEWKEKLVKHLAEVKFAGTSDPSSAMFKAMEFKPVLLFVLSERRFEPDFVELVTKKNVGGVRINTIRFTWAADDFHLALRELAKQNRGFSKLLDAKKLVD